MIQQLTRLVLWNSYLTSTTLLLFPSSDFTHAHTLLPSSPGLLVAPSTGNDENIPIDSYATGLLIRLHRQRLQNNPFLLREASLLDIVLSMADIPALVQVGRPITLMYE